LLARQQKINTTLKPDHTADSFVSFHRYLMSMAIFPLLLCFVFLFHLTFSSVAESGRGAFSTTGGGARDRIFGHSFVAVADDANAMKWNPAGITSLPQRVVTFSHASLFTLGSGAFDFSDTSSSVNEDIVNIANLFPSFAVPVGISYHRIGTHGLIFSDKNGTILDLNGDYKEQLLTLSTGKMISVGKSKISFGLNLNRYTVSSIHKRQGLGLDTGILFSPKNRLIPQIGVTLNGLSGGFDLSSGQEETKRLPSRLTLGLAYRLLKDQLTIASGLAKTSTAEDWKYGITGEYNIYRFYPIHLSLRSGYHFRGSRSENQLNINARKANLGFSLYINRFKLDYAYEPHTLLGNTHRMTVSMLQVRPTEIHWQNGMQHYMMLEDESALTSFQKLISLNPHSARGYHQIARIYERRGELDNAIQSLEHVKQLDENYFGQEKLQQLIEDLEDQRQLHTGLRQEPF